MEDIYEIWNTIKQGINEADGKIIGKEKNTTRNSFCDEECQVILEDKERAYYNKMINRNTSQNEQEYTSERKEAIKIFRQKKKRVLYKSNLEQIEIAYTDNEAKKFYQKVNSIRKGFIVSNKEKSPAKVV